MAVMKRQTDDKGRVTLPQGFANSLVLIEVVSEDEVRVRRARVVPKRYSFKKLMAGVTKENIHAEIKTGPAVGGEGL